MTPFGREFYYISVVFYSYVLDSLDYRKVSNSIASEELSFIPCLYTEKLHVFSDIDLM